MPPIMLLAMMNEQFNASAKGVNVNLLVLGYGCFAKVESYSSATNIESRSVKSLAAIDVLVASVVNRAAYALAVVAYWQRTLKPLVAVINYAFNYKMHAYVQKHRRGNVFEPRLLP